MWRSLVTLPLPPQELFGKVVPHHCPLHLVPAPPEGREHPAPTIHATHTQFINVVNESITSDSEQDSRGQGPGGGGSPAASKGPGDPLQSLGNFSFLENRVSSFPAGLPPSLSPSPHSPPPLWPSGGRVLPSPNQLSLSPGNQAPRLSLSALCF